MRQALQVSLDIDGLSAQEVRGAIDSSAHLVQVDGVLAVTCFQWKGLWAFLY